MVRVAGLREQAFGDGAPQDFRPDGMRPIAQLQRIARRTQELVAAQYRCWNESVLPQLADSGRHAVEARRARPGATAKRSIASSASGRFRFSRRWPSIRPIPARAITTAACIWPRCSERRRGLGPKQLVRGRASAASVAAAGAAGARRRAAIHSVGRSRLGPVAGIVRRLRRAVVDDVPHHARQRHRAVGARIRRHAAADRRPAQGPAAGRSGAAGSRGRRQRRTARPDHRRRIDSRRRAGRL